MANHWYAYSCVGGSLDGKQILLQPPLPREHLVKVAVFEPTPVSDSPPETVPVRYVIERYERQPGNTYAYTGEAC